jgi:hypothetical protein
MMLMMKAATTPPKTITAKRVLTKGKDGSKRLFLVKMSGGRATTLILPKKGAQGRLKLPAQLIRGIKKAAEQQGTTTAAATTATTATATTAWKPANYALNAPRGGSSGSWGDTPIKRDASLLTDEPDVATSEADADEETSEETPPDATAPEGQEESKGILAMLWPKDAPIYKRPGLWLGGLAILGGAYFYTKEEID